MSREYYNTRKTGANETTVTIVDFKPDIPEEETQALPLGASARDTCGDGTNEFLHISPLVTWQVFPVRYFIESSIPSTLHKATEDSFNEFNFHAGFKFYERTDNLALAKIRVGIGPIDVPGATIARAQWSYNTSRKEITTATITFDSHENWGDLANESCGRVGNIFDLANVGVHEVGHISGLAHAPTDQLQTMYASTSQGKTLGRTLGNGDIMGFKLAYKIQDNPPPPPPPNQKPLAGPQNITTKEREFIIALIGSDPDNNLPLTFRIRSFPDPTKANLTAIDGNKVTYKALPEFEEGQDEFTFTVTDNLDLESDPAKVTINLQKIPQPPEPPEEHTHTFTKSELIQIKVLQLIYENMKKSGIQSAIDKSREELQTYVLDRLVEKHTRIS